MPFYFYEYSKQRLRIANGKLQLVIAAFQPCKGKIKKWKLPNNSQKNEK
jgi:hypothetical protein